MRNTAMTTVPKQRKSSAQVSFDDTPNITQSARIIHHAGDTFTPHGPAKQLQFPPDSGNQHSVRDLGNPFISPTIVQPDAKTSKPLDHSFMRTPGRVPTASYGQRTPAQDVVRNVRTPQPFKANPFQPFQKEEKELERKVQDSYQFFSPSANTPSAFQPDTPLTNRNRSSQIDSQRSPPDFGSGMGNFNNMVNANQAPDIFLSPYQNSASGPTYQSSAAPTPSQQAKKPSVRVAVSASSSGSGFAALPKLTTDLWKGDDDQDEKQIRKRESWCGKVIDWLTIW
jgi:hypothetical protein